MSHKRGLATTINGRKYRSQLEARWASFFSSVGWPFEYEAFQLRGWIPDFLLLGSSPVLVEIKPVYVFPQFVVDKIEESNPPHDVLILGCTIPVRPLGTEGIVSPHTLGWLGERSGDDDHTHLWWGDAVLGETPTELLGFHHGDGSPFDLMTGSDLTQVSPYKVRSHWADAGNKTQWGNDR